MTLLTKGMGVVLKAIKKGSKSVKQGFVAPKTNKPFYTMTGTVIAGKTLYEIAKSKSQKKRSTGQTVHKGEK